MRAGALGRSRGKGGIRDGLGARGRVVALDLGCGPRVSMEARGRCRDLGRSKGQGFSQGYGVGPRVWIGDQGVGAMGKDHGWR